MTSWPVSRVTSKHHSCSGAFSCFSATQIFWHGPHFLARIWLTISSSLAKSDTFHSTHNLSLRYFGMAHIFWPPLVDVGSLLLWPRVTPWRVACATFGLPCVTTCATIKHHPLHLLVQQVGMRQKQNPKRPKLPLGGFEKNAFVYVAVAEKPLSDFSQGTLYGKVF